MAARGEADVPEPDLCLFEEVPAGEVRRRIEVITTSLLAGLGVWKFDKLKPVTARRTRTRTTRGRHAHAQPRGPRWRAVVRPYGTAARARASCGRCAGAPRSVSGSGTAPHGHQTSRRSSPSVRALAAFVCACGAPIHHRTLRA